MKGPVAPGSWSIKGDPKSLGVADTWDALPLGFTRTTATRVPPPQNTSDTKRRDGLDRLFRTLGHPMRRRIVTALMTSSPRWRDEFETEEFRTAEQERDRVALELHYRHLSKLGEADVIDWKPTTGMVTRGERVEAIRPLLGLLDEHRDELRANWA